MSRKKKSQPMVGGASLSFGWNPSRREFSIDPHGDQAVTLCRGIARIEPRRDGKFYLQEMYWGELDRFCRRIGWYPPLLHNYVNRARPDAPLAPEQTPTGMILRDYQQVGAGMLTVPGGWLLEDDMGLGKTAQILAAYTILRQRREARGMIVFAPASVVEQWSEESEKFLGFPAYCINAQKDILMVPNQGIVVCAYSKTWRDPYQGKLLKMVREGGWIVVFDEVHKSGGYGTAQHQALCAMVHGVTHKWAATGTGVRNQPDSILPTYRLVTGIDINPAHFRAYYSTSTGDWNLRKLEQIQVVRRQTGLRRTKAEVLKELPPLTEILHQVSLTQQQARMLQDLADGDALIKHYEDADPEVLEARGILAWYTRALQITSHPRLCGGAMEQTEKWPILEDILRARGDEQVIVWSYHPEALEILRNAIEQIGIESRVVHGGVPQKARDEIRKAFVAGKFPVLLANPLSYGEGVNLQCASIMAYWDEHYSKDKWEQSRARAYRMGQTRPVTIHYLRTKGTVEMKCYEWVRKKKEMADRVTGEATGV